MEAQMILLTEHSDTARVTVWANKEADGSRCFTVDAHIWEGESTRALGIARHYDLRKALADADAVLAGYVTQTEQLKGEAF
jgi:hypothetical protein